MRRAGWGNICAALLTAALLLAFLPARVFAAEAAAPEEWDFAVGGLEGAIAEYMEERRLDEDNFAMGWYDTVSEESFFYGEDHWMVAGSMYKLPLNMLYTDRLAAGECERTDAVRNYTVDSAMYSSIVYSDNDAAQALRAGLGLDRDSYREALAQYSGIAAEELPRSFYEDNCMSPRFLINTLRKLYGDSGHYAELIERMKLAHPGRYFQKADLDYEIAHKYGYFEGSLDDCGIIYTPRPYLLVVFLRGVAASEETLAELCALTAAYAVWLDAKAAQEQEEAEARNEAVEARNEAAEASAISAASAVETPVPDVPAPVPELLPESRAGLPAEYRHAAAAVALAAPAAAGIFCLARGRGKRGAVFAKRAALCAVCVLAAALGSWALLWPADTAAAAGPGEMPVPTELPLRAPAAPPADSPAAAPVETPLRAPPDQATPVPPEELPPAAADTPEKTEWLLSFAGDCTIGTLHEWQGAAARNNMLYVVGEDYAYPFAHVREYFTRDDFTMVNLEGTFTDRTDAVGKDYRFRAAPRYAEVLTEGGIEAVTLANNHSGDYREGGLADTQTALEARGVLWADAARPLIVTLEGGLKLGVVAFNAVEIDLAVGDVEGYMERVRPLYAKCTEEHCDLVLAFVHWGWEYYTRPEDWMVRFGRELADMGCDMVIGSHAHVLQPMEYWNGTPIFYSLGNFCYGGHSNPADQDTVIVRQRVAADGAGGYVLVELELIPCRISSAEGFNDFSPAPYAPDSAEYRRVLDKLNAEENGA